MEHSLTRGEKMHIKNPLNKLINKYLQKNPNEDDDIIIDLIILIHLINIKQTILEKRRTNDFANENTADLLTIFEENLDLMSKDVYNHFDEILNLLKYKK